MSELGYQISIGILNFAVKPLTFFCNSLQTRIGYSMSILQYRGAHFTISRHIHVLQNSILNLLPYSQIITITLIHAF